MAICIQKAEFYNIKIRTFYTCKNRINASKHTQYKVRWYCTIKIKKWRHQWPPRSVSPVHTCTWRKEVWWSGFTKLIFIVFCKEFQWWASKGLQKGHYLVYMRICFKVKLSLHQHTLKAIPKVNVGVKPILSHFCVFEWMKQLIKRNIIVSLLQPCQVLNKGCNISLFPKVLCHVQSIRIVSTLWFWCVQIDVNWLNTSSHVDLLVKWENPCGNTLERYQILHGNSAQNLQTSLNINMSWRFFLCQI